MRAGRLGRLLVVGVALVFASGCGTVVRKTDAALAGDPANWVVEQMPGGSVTMEAGALVIRDVAGCTVWWRDKLVAPVEISYDAEVIDAGGPFDRVSDLNCLWMAREAEGMTAPFERSPARSGRFSDYNSLLAYYVGQGANDNTTTRFRRYDGTASRPLLPEHDLRQQAVLLEPNRTYRIRLVATGGGAEYWCDGVKIFAYEDAAPLSAGWFGIRTVRSHLRISNLRITTPAR